MARRNDEISMPFALLTVKLSTRFHALLLSAHGFCLLKTANYRSYVQTFRLCWPLECFLFLLLR